MIRKTRVVHVVPAIFGARGVTGGAERYAFELARHMADYTPTTLVGFGSQERTERIGNLSVRVLGEPWYVRGQRTNPLSPGLISELRGADIVHCHQQHILASSVCAVFCKLTGRRVFVTDLGGGGWDISAYIGTDYWYDGHLHISEYSRRVCGHVQKPFARVILGGVDAEKFSPGESVRRDGSVIFVGRIVPHKGIDVLLSAIPDHLKVEVIGPAYDLSYLARLRVLAKGKRVSFRHNCDDAALIDAYRRALCVVLPSVYRSAWGTDTKVPELLGQTLLEGMACAAPGICTMVGAMPEIVTDGVTGFVVPPNNPEVLAKRLRWLAEHPENAALMGRAARARVVEKFSWHGVVTRCLDAYGVHTAAA